MGAGPEGTAPPLPVGNWARFIPRVGTHRVAEQTKRDVNGALSVIRSLARGTVSAISTAGSTRVEWEKAAPLAKELSLDVAGRISQWNASVSDAPTGPDAFRLLAGATGAAPGESAANSSAPSPASQLRRMGRGDLCEGTVDQIALPPPGGHPVSIVEVAPETRDYLDHFRSRMLAPPAVREARGGRRVRGYTAAFLRSKTNMLRFCARMWMAGMLATTAVRECELDVFTVIKSWAAATGELALALTTAATEI